jgi:hypothetical protein
MEFRRESHHIKNNTMSKPIRLSIQNPCHEKWENFISTASGGFCQSCNKNVMDFTKKTDLEIIKFLKRKPANSCGRFRPEQLKAYSIPGNYRLSIKPSRMLLRAGFISLLIAFINKPTMAQTPAKPVTEQTPAQKLKASPGGKRFISGIVVDNDSVPMPGVNVVVAGMDIGVVTDANGRFELSEPIKESQRITFSFIGYKTHTVLLTYFDSNYLHIKLDIDTLVLGEPLAGVMGCFVVRKRSLFSRIKGWFN